MNLAALMAGLSAAMILTGIMCIVLGFSRPNQAREPTSRFRTAFAARRRELLIASAAGTAAVLLTRWPVSGVIAAGAVLGLPRVITGRSARGRIQKLEALEQWTRRVSDLLSATRGLEEALALAAARNVPSPIAGPVTTLARRVGVIHMPTEEALRMFADELADPVGDRISAALILVARRRGSGASNVLNRLAELVARDVTDRREVEAARAEHRTAIRWIIAIFVAFTGIALVQQHYVAPYGTPIGQLVLALVAAFYGAALWWLHRLSSASPGHRFIGSSS